MPTTSVRNDTENMLCLWLEPWGSDHWMRPGERLTVVVRDAVESTNEVFEAVVHDQGISVWVNAGLLVDVIDADGHEAECGHQRPIETVRQWVENARQALDRVANKSPQVQQAASRQYELMMRILDAAEAREAQSDDPNGATGPLTVAVPE